MIYGNINTREYWLGVILPKVDSTDITGKAHFVKKVKMT